MHITVQKILILILAIHSKKKKTKKYFYKIILSKVTKHINNIDKERTYLREL